MFIRCGTRHCPWLPHGPSMIPVLSHTGRIDLNLHLIEEIGQNAVWMEYGVPFHRDTSRILFVEHRDLDRVNLLGYKETYHAIIYNKVPSNSKIWNNPLLQQCFKKDRMGSHTERRTPIFNPSTYISHWTLVAKKPQGCS